MVRLPAGRFCFLTSVVFGRGFGSCLQGSQHSELLQQTVHNRQKEGLLPFNSVVMLISFSPIPLPSILCPSDCSIPLGNGWNVECLNKPASYTNTSTRLNCPRPHQSVIQRCTFFLLFVFSRQIRAK